MRVVVVVSFRVKGGAHVRVCAAVSGGVSGWLTARRSTALRVDGRGRVGAGLAGGHGREFGGGG